MPDVYDGLKSDESGYGIISHPLESTLTYACLSTLCIIMFLVIWKVFSRQRSSNATASLEEATRFIREVLQERSPRQETNPSSRSSDGRASVSMFAGNNKPQLSGKPRCHNVGGNYSVDNSTIVVNFVIPNERSSWHVWDILFVCLIIAVHLICLVGLMGVLEGVPC